MGRTLVSISPTSSFFTLPHHHPSSSSTTSFPNIITPSKDDPFYPFLKPPAGETPAQRAEREGREADARKVSDEIDGLLKEERAERKKRKGRTVKVLLLGQSESGKSTTLKNFQLTYTPKAWQEERSSWRAVVQINLCRTANLILDVLAEELARTSSQTSSGASSSDNDNSSSVNAQESSSSSPTSISIVDAALPSPGPLPFKNTHRVLLLRLAPLKQVQRALEMRLGAGAEEPVDDRAHPRDGASPTGEAAAAPFGASGAGADAVSFPSNGNGSTKRAGREREVCIRSTTGWKAALERLRPSSSSNASSSSGSNSSPNGKSKSQQLEEDEEILRVLAGCREDLGALWRDRVVRMMLERRRVRTRVEEGAGGFFLSDVDRIAVQDYQPSDDDIVRARLRTTGVQEHRFLFERGSEQGQEWLMYDVGGTRSLRAAWPPFFDDMAAIIFLAPISCFDEKLAEDRRVNRLEDSFLLWKAVCANQLLSKTMLVLFLNKCDLLERKLEEEKVEFRRYVPSYGERRNEVGAVTKYLKQKFKEMSKQYSPEPRGFYVHLTSVIDTKATAITLGAVREGILRDQLRGVSFL